MWYFWKTSDWKWCLFENIFLRCNQILAPPFRFKDRTKFILQFWNCQNNICVAPSLVSGWQRWPDPSVHCCTLSLCHLGSDDHHRNPNTNTKVILWATNRRLIKHLVSDFLLMRTGEFDLWFWFTVSPGNFSNLIFLQICSALTEEVVWLLSLEVVWPLLQL